MAKLTIIKENQAKTYTRKTIPIQNYNISFGIGNMYFIVLQLEDR